MLNIMLRSSNEDVNDERQLTTKIIEVQGCLFYTNYWLCEGREATQSLD